MNEYYIMEFVGAVIRSRSLSRQRSLRKSVISSTECDSVVIKKFNSINLNSTNPENGSRSRARKRNSCIGVEQNERRPTYEQIRVPRHRSSSNYRTTRANSTSTRVDSTRKRTISETSTPLVTSNPTSSRRTSRSTTRSQKKSRKGRPEILKTSMKTKTINHDPIISVQEYSEDDVTCAICLDILHRPRVLPCSHAFCLLCLQNYINSCRVVFTCPSCRGGVDLPAQGVSGLPQNKNLTEAAQKLKLKLSGKVICHLCHGGNNDVCICKHCDVPWCKGCGIAHISELLKNTKKLLSRLKDIQEIIPIQDIPEMVEMKAEWDDTLAKINSEINNSLENQITSYEALSYYYGELITLSKSQLLPKGTKVLLEPELTSPPESPSPLDNSDEPELDLDLPAADSSIIYKKKSFFTKRKWSHHLVNRMSGIAFCPSNSNIYVIGSDSCKILVLDQCGKVLNSWGTRGHGEGQLLCPTGIAFSHVADEVFVTDKWRHCIYGFDLEGNYLRQLGRKGKGYGHFISPDGIATDKNGRIYIADTCNNRVQVLDNDGVFLKEIGVVSCMTMNNGLRYSKTELNEPTGVAVSHDAAKVYVADAGNNRIKIYDSETGHRLMVIGSRGMNKGQFDSPECVAVDPGGFIIVGDSGNGRIQVFTPEGRFVRYFGTKINRHGEFGWVASVALSKNFDIVVTDFKNSMIGVY